MDFNEPQNSEDMDSRSWPRTPVQDPYALNKTCATCNRKLYVKESLEIGSCVQCRGKGFTENRDYRFGDDQREDALKAFRNNPRYGL